MAPSAPISNSAIPDALAQLGPIFGKQILIEILPQRARDTPRGAAADLLVGVAWGKERFEFAAEAKSRNTPRAIEEALRQARRLAAASGRLPMVFAPYLSESRIEQLAEEAVSGLDLCGNGLLIVPGRIVLRRTGQPNRYPESAPSRFAYRGATSLVPRVFLRRAEYQSVGQVRDEVTAAGAAVALSTVSKALARMADDLIVERTGGRITLIQPGKLLDALAADFAAPKPDRVLQVKTSLRIDEIFRRAQGSSHSSERLRIVLSGASSQDRYTSGLRADIPVVYTDNLGELKRRLGDAWTPEDRFSNLNVIETCDQSPFFDARRADDGVSFGSPVQVFLELATSGDKRDREMAQQVRARILPDLRR